MAALFTTVGCKKDLLDVKNENNYSDQTYFKKAPQFNEALIATYSVFLHQGMYSREMYFIYDLIGNDAEKDAPLLGDLLQLSDYSYASSNGLPKSLWASLYRMIFRANIVIGKANEWQPTETSDQDLKKQYIAEAKFLRSFAYFYLVNSWGRVPLRLSIEDSKKSASPRVAVTEIWKTIEADLAAAIPGLPVAHDATNRGRATKGAAIALLGKSQLFQKKYSEAATTLESLTKMPFAYSLNPSFDNQFSESSGTSPETVFDVPHKWTDWAIGNQYYMFGGQEAWGGKTAHTGRAQEYGFNDWRNVFISTAQVNAFTYPHPVTGLAYTDPRAKLTFYGDALSGGDVDYCNTCAGGAKPYVFNASNGYRWRKYEPYEWLEQSGGPQSSINSQVIRYSDVLLMLAESYIEQNQADKALPLINQVRARVGAVAYPTLGSQTTATSILRRERQVELAGEQVRWFDLVRWGIAKQTLNAEKQIQIGKQPFQDKHVLLPIPQAEKDSNPEVATDVSNEWN